MTWPIALLKQHREGTAVVIGFDACERSLEFEDEVARGICEVAFAAQ